MKIYRICRKKLSQSIISPAAAALTPSAFELLLMAWYFPYNGADTMERNQSPPTFTSLVPTFRLVYSSLK